MLTLVTSNVESSENVVMSLLHSSPLYKFRTLNKRILVKVIEVVVRKIGSGVMRVDEFVIV